MSDSLAKRYFCLAMWQNIMFSLQHRKKRFPRYFNWPIILEIDVHSYLPHIPLVEELLWHVHA